MENTSKILFPDDAPQWYVALGDRWEGPLTSADVYEKVIAQEFTLAHFVWKPGQADWKRICDVKTFQLAVPSLPEKDVRSEVKEASKPIVKQAARRGPGTPPPAPGKKPAPDVSPEERIWFLFYNDSQYGPFSDGEIVGALKSGKIHPRVHIWKEGMDDWDRIERVEAFAEAAAATAKKAGPPKPPKTHKTPSAPKPDLRTAPRKPLVAKIMMAHGASLHSGICRDISIGGLQVLTDQIPGPVGSRVKMNVSAPGGLAPFVAEGVVVRVLEDRRGFSFRFERLADDSKRAIENYINAITS